MFDFIGIIGRASVITGFVATVAASFLYFRSLKRPALAGFARTGFHITTTTVFLTAAALLILILKHQFQYEYVWSYSSRDLPTGLLMSTFYAGQEGSFLLWTVWVSVVGIVMLAYTQKHNNEREVMGVYTSILAFLLLLLVVKNPFALIEGGQVPADGRGLNPLLQNFWMQIHPPILFIGFAAMTPPFALAIAALMQKKYQDWVVSSLPWVVSGAMVLGLGISLGGFWAYETLGWGGWWGWDPVENSSLLPWLVSISLVHTMLTQKRTKGLVMTNFILAILAFVMVLYSTFLTRSGVLGDSSVHSFVDPGRFAFTILVLFMFVFIDVGFGFLFTRFTRWGAALYEKFSGWKLLGIMYLVAVVPSIPIFGKIAGDLVPVFTDMTAGQSALVEVLVFPFLAIAHVLNWLSVLWIPAIIFKVGFIVYTLTGRMHSERDFRSFNMLSRETFLGLGSGVVGVLTVIVLLGTSLPVVPKPVVGVINDVFGWINNAVGTNFALGNTVEPQFYDAMGLPLGILMAGMAGLALLLKWKANDGKGFLRRLMLPGLLAVGGTVALFFGGVRDGGMLALGCAALFSLMVNISVGYSIIRGNPRFTGAYMAHIGIAFMLLGIIGSGFYSTKQSIVLPQGETKDALGYKLTYTGYEPFWNGQRYFFHVFLAEADGTPIDTVKTVMFVSQYGGQEQVMRNPGIAKFLTKDVYIEPQALEQPDPEGGERRQFTKGQTFEYNGYRVTFTDFDMNNRQGSGLFTIGGMFRIEKYGQQPIEVMAQRITDDAGERVVPATVPAGDLVVEILGMMPNKEDLAMSAIDVRLRNPNVKPDPANLRETLVVEASIKPFISLVWAGIILMVAGFFIAGMRRRRDARQLEVPARPAMPYEPGLRQREGKAAPVEEAAETNAEN